MKTRLRNIASLFLLVLFLLPSAIKLEHHHYDEEYCQDGKLHFHDHHEKCTLCVFEFQVFTSGHPSYPVAKDAPVTGYQSGYSVLFPENRQSFSIFLRGPPVIQV